MAFQLPDLPYAYDALEPHIDEQTMRTHHDKHHAGYTNKLNAAIEGTDLADKSIEEILSSVSQYSTGIRNNGGGYYNHKLFWEVLSPNGGGNPSGELAEAINRDFGGLEQLKEEMKNAGAGQFGSGWAWLSVKDGKLHVSSTANQDNPLMDISDANGSGGTPIFGIDVWEHAYYLKYQNKRGDYLDAIFNIVDWDAVAERYADAK